MKHLLCELKLNHCICRNFRGHFSDLVYRAPRFLRRTPFKPRAITHLIVQQTLFWVMVIWQEMHYKQVSIC